MVKQLSTKDRALKEGWALLQQHGYNGFSFQDIAERLGIKKPSLYVHFASKETLILAILKSYGELFTKWSTTINTDKPIERVRKVFDVFYSFTSDHQKVCPILALTADTDIPSKEIKKAMHTFVDNWLEWLAQQIAEGQKDGSIRKDMEPAALAAFIYSQGMGSQYQSRLRKDPTLTLKSGDMIIQLIRSSK
jgi:TetR/AcrR family transcriptional regulator, transcriptional repressor for nem operon